MASAGDLEWEPKQVSGTCAEFTLTQSEYTKRMYPWDFTCTLRFTLDGGSLLKEHITRNDSSSTMYYEIGGHDAYTLCWQKDEKITDYFVEFEGTGRADAYCYRRERYADRRAQPSAARRRQAAYFA